MVRKSNASDRLLAAALEMFSTRGMAATTREIADAAGVNEVTLFRLFESKDQLLTAVVSEVIRAESEAMDRVDFVDFDIRRDIATLAEVFYATHEQYQAFLRTMLAHRFHPKLTEDIMRDVIQPLRDKFIRYLAEGQRRGVIRPGIVLAAAVDSFTGMIFAAVLRRAVYTPGYSRETYLKTCVDLFLEGISAPTPW
jgi:AcrR family transcriptional regulator